MQTTHFLQKAAPLTFRRFSRKGYALHACLGREVRIGVLTAAMLATAAPALEARNMAEADTLRPTEAADAGSGQHSEAVYRLHDQKGFLDG